MAPPQLDALRGSSRLYRKPEHRPGDRSTRWDVEAIDLRHVMNSHTATEIYPIAVNDSDRCAKITARLIEQGVSRDYRLIHPAPLHAARQMDEDHPHHRRTMADDSSTGTARQAAT